MDISSIFAPRPRGENRGVNDLVLQRANGEARSISFASGVVVSPGDAIVISTANGGGWGAMLDRK
jgi:N-methylhydantoinase B